MKKWVKLAITSAAVLAFAAGCGNKAATDESGSASTDASKEEVTVKLGIIGADTDVWDDVKDRLQEEGINLEYVKFTEYSQPNSALASGDIDLNSFQHQYFLDNFNEEHGTDLVSIGNTVNAPLGIYSEKIKDISEIKDGDKVAIPNDVTNGGRALLLLQTAGLIKVDEAAKQAPTVSDITDNPKNLEIVELEASQTARALQDVTVSVINSGMAVDAGFVPKEDAIYLEPVDDTSRPYVNIIAARKEDEDNEVYKKVVAAYQTEETAKVIEETSKGSSIPAWETFGKK
ncbi:MetQ/NlpA family ABC transporter substrate-binding protein [Enterococcus saccharolyticus]|uniref:Lipoprotein n=1 Tax=Candidatus Enterococcus willemsii TaxID=1857215 RepID=A0ABQ6Z2B7_9ENTE|nr:MULTISPECIES: MetQ/NlpA family ABC transporter substrate-binding protein [Enterococcus]KAF1305728.1 metal ABC transporter substrate-binding protein [Enterococcus sp. CU12B]MCD5001488.1 MetQ/NlpA family ABC transporter substrate-binding protein [Enterococcus saccharolyticus]